MSSSKEWPRTAKGLIDATVNTVYLEDAPCCLRRHAIKKTARIVTG